MIRSGPRAAISSYRYSGVPVNAPLFSTAGCAPPSSSCAQGQVAYGWSPYQSVTAIGRTPIASTGSWSLYPTVTTRCGALGISVVPLRCSTAIGNAPEAAGVAAGAAGSGEPPPHADRRPSVPRAPAPVSSLRRVRWPAGTRGTAGMGPPDDRPSDGEAEA